MDKKAVIVAVLVPESKEKNNDELEEEIFDELSRAPESIPWMKEVEKVEIVDS